MTLPVLPDAEFIDFQQAVAGRYSLERELGRGGMGIVFLARELRLARPVAIKLLPRALSAGRPELRDRFLREAQMAAQLSHPNIVPIHHVDEVDDFVFFVMAYIEGETLGERLRSAGALPPAEAAQILRDVGWALAYAHLRGIVHRDIKPGNILLERGSGRALVTDFGIAGDLQTPSTADGGYVRGTVHFLSPEQAAGAPVDGRSDLYSLGITAYYALTGRLPFDAASPMGVLVAHASKPVRPIVEVTPNVPHKLASAVERCLEKRPELRWESGEKFAEAVDAAFEMPKELPAPLRAWLRQGDRSRTVRFVVGFYGITGIAALWVSGQPALSLGVLALVGTLLTSPIFTSVRRLIAGGFSLDAIRGAVATHTVRKREEFEYESSGAFSLSPQRLIIGAGLLAASAAAMAVAMPFVSTTMKLALPSMIGFAGSLGIAVSVAAFIRYAQLGKVRWLRSPRLAFWKSMWGERVYRLAGLGLKRPVMATALTQHTEVALGRALDSLFASLPRETRRELKDVPATVRRLEDDAQKLREALEQLDSAVSAATRAGKERDAEALAREREAAADRLATTVTALETIRLGLLRLQIGAAPIASVTAAIEAATHLGRELEIAAESQREVSAALKPRN
ncbi:MAG: serine/threonine-protein kinase [Gemmatimonadetes bacterium]|nr:serine/threonine-protein kinase [Gemmatimonadota bacterium]